MQLYQQNFALHCKLATPIGRERQATNCERMPSRVMLTFPSTVEVQPIILYIVHTSTLISSIDSWWFPPDRFIGRSNGKPCPFMYAVLLNTLNVHRDSLVIARGNSDCCVHSCTSVYQSNVVTCLPCSSTSNCASRCKHIHINTQHRKHCNLIVCQAELAPSVAREP